MPTDASTVVFMGSPDFAVPTLEALIAASDFEVVCVVSQPDRPRGRGRKTLPTAVRACAERYGIAPLQMSKACYGSVAAEVVALAPDFLVVAAFGIILKSDLLDLARFGCVNLHASLLPKYRGVSPVQAAILNGDAETGCTTMMVDEGVDTGGILLTAVTAVRSDDTAGTLEARLSRVGAPLVVKTLRGLADGSIEPCPQNDELASYARKVKKEHGEIDWTLDAVQLDRRIRAMSPWPSAFSRFRNKRLIVVEAVPRQDPEGSGAPGAAGSCVPGTVAAITPLLIHAGDGFIELRRIKIEGRKEMAAESFAAGYRIKPGDRLG